jgi:hypothetical protein
MIRLGFYPAITGDVRGYAAIAGGGTLTG